MWDARPLSLESAQRDNVRHLVNSYVQKSGTRESLLDAIAQDPWITPADRESAIKQATRSREVRVTSEAQGLLRSLLVGQALFVDEAVDRISSDKQLTEEVRNRVREIAETATENHASLNNASWKVVRSTDVEPAACQRALRQVSRALELRPNTGSYVNTLGVAQYRVGDFKGVITTLRKSMELNHKRSSQPVISDLVFVAMSHYQLGNSEQATEAVKVARRFILLAKLKADSEDAVFAREMEALFAKKAPSTPKPN